MQFFFLFFGAPKMNGPKCSKSSMNIIEQMCLDRSMDKLDQIWIHPNVIVLRANQYFFHNLKSLMNKRRQPKYNHTKIKYSYFHKSNPIETHFLNLKYFCYLNQDFALSNLGMVTTWEWDILLSSFFLLIVLQSSYISM